MAESPTNPGSHGGPPEPSGNEPQDGASPTARAPIRIANPADGGLFYWVGKLYGFAVIALGIALVVTGVSTYACFAAKVPEVPDFRRYAQAAPGVSRFYAADGTLLGEFAREWREVVPYEAIPEKLVQAFLAAEDHTFFEHRGIYLRGILRAAWRNLATGDFEQGGSTITQQLAKQLALDADKSLTRKVKEAILARRMEALYSKRAILSVYLNHIFLGNGAYGVKAAALRYFGKELDELEVGEMALIAGLAQAPSRYSPVRAPERARERRDAILDRMVRHGYLDAADAGREKEKPIALRPYREVFPARMPYYAEHVRREVNERYGHAVLMEGALTVETAVEPVTDGLAQDNVVFGARRQDKRQGFRGPEAHLGEEAARRTFLERAEALYGDAPLDPGRRYLGLVTEVSQRRATVRVGARDHELPLANMRWAHRWSARAAVNDQTVTSVTQALAVGDVVWVAAWQPVTEEHSDWHLAKGVNPHWVRPPSEERLARLRKESEDTVVLEQIPHPQAAIFTADHHTGYVVAMSGGTDYALSEYNRAVQACRQPGSTYKPIYYSTALDLGYGFDTPLRDVPTKQVDPITGEVWVPQNLGGTIDTEVSLEYALVFSKNIPSVGVFLKVGARKLDEWAKKLGFTTEVVPEVCFEKQCTALALGAQCTYLHELTGAFAVFAQSGRAVDWVFVRRVLDRDGNVLEDNTAYYDPMLPPADRLDRVYATAGVRRPQAISARTAFLTSKLLRAMITHGFSWIVRETGVKAAGKTGTSSETMDTSFVGYTSRWITAVWLGDDRRVRPLGRDDAAYMTVVPMWARYMAGATREHPNHDIPWEVPEGVDPRDRGDHLKGGRLQMPLVYKRAPRPPWAEGGGDDG